MAASQVNRDDDVMRILIFTDTHLGHKDTDEILGQDSIETFEEILKIAKDNKVSYIVHLLKLNIVLFMGRVVFVFFYEYYI